MQSQLVECFMMHATIARLCFGGASCRKSDVIFRATEHASMSCWCSLTELRDVASCAALPVKAVLMSSGMNAVFSSFPNIAMVQHILG